jgi:hypothetical protein
VSTYCDPGRASAVSALFPPAPPPCPEGDGVVSTGDGLVVPLATGVGLGDGFVVAVGEGLEVLVGLGVGFVVRLCEGVPRDDEGPWVWVVPPITAGVLRVGDGLERVVRREFVGVGVFCTVEVPPESFAPRWLSATTRVPITTAATRPTSAIIGSETERARRPAAARPPLPGSPTTGSGAVGGRW